MNYIIFAVTIVLFISLYFIFRKFINKKLVIVKKCLALFLALCFFIRYFAGDSLLNGVVGLNEGNPFSSSFLCCMVALQSWLSIASVVIIILQPFFKYNILKNYAKTFCLVVNVVDTILLSNIAYSFTGTYEITLCGAFLSIEVALSLLYSLYLFLTNHYFKMPKKELIEMLIALPIILILSVPPYLPQALFGNFASQNMKDFSLYHRIYLYLAMIFLIGMYFLLKRIKDREYIRMALLYISLVTLISYCYNYDFAIFIEPTRWPLHLCNTAMFIIPLCLIFRLDKLFYFTLFINVLGAFLAMLMPNYNDNFGFFTPNVVRFWINHSMAFAMPVLIILLGIYRRPRLREFKYSMVGFLIYFLLVLVINAWFENYDTSVDFFFLNSDFIVSKLGQWAENTMNYVWNIKIGSLTFTFYPLYQFLFFVVYVILGLGMWFLYVWIFTFQDFYTALAEKNRKIKLDENILCLKYNQKEVNACMNEESVNKLVVKNAYKRYGNNKRYSLTNASFEVNAGEILGFLGPNGAGKSTLIKCIVGVQPLSKGSIEINGYDIEKQPLKAKEQFGFVPDHYALYENLTGREYINYIADIYGVSQEDRQERIEKYVTLLNLKDAFDDKIRTYSHGMKQKIAIISALVHNPKLWILDEPLTGLDPNSIFEVKECMKEHAKNGNIVFFSSHIIDIVEKLCDRIIIVKNGHIVDSTTLKELKKKKLSLEKYYLDIIDREEEKSEEAIVVEEELPTKEPESKFFEEKEGWLKKLKKRRKDKKLEEKAKEPLKAEENNDSKEGDKE